MFKNFIYYEYNDLNFKKVEVVAESKEAAIAQVESTLFHVMVMQLRLTKLES